MVLLPLPKGRHKCGTDDVVIDNSHAISIDEFVVGLTQKCPQLVTTHWRFYHHAVYGGEWEIDRTMKIKCVQNT